jgi:branched-chain amino acid transport system ATP-binding protein
MSALVVTRLAKSFGGVKAVVDVSFAVGAGEVVALIGPNGAGKTTTFNIINGQIMPDAGRVHLNGEDITGLSPRGLWREGVGRTFQITATFPSMTVAENIEVALMSREARTAILGARSKLRKARAEELLALVGLADQAGRTCGVLAYGDLKRVELAIALANEPRLLLMDEPTAGMAPKERGDLMELATRLAREKGTAVLFTEHDMDVVFGHARHVIVMSGGAIIAQGSGEEIRRDPTVRAVYLGTAAVAGR